MFKRSAQVSSTTRILVAMMILGLAVVASLLAVARPAAAQSLLGEVYFVSGPDEFDPADESEFEFDSDGSGLFECALDGVDWRRCRSPHTLYDVPEGQHTFAVRVFGELNPANWATYTWNVDRTAPALQLLGERPTERGRIILAFNSSEPVERMRCWHDGRDPRPCTLNRAGFGEIERGPHRLFVEAFDRAGNSGVWSLDIRLGANDGIDPEDLPPVVAATSDRFVHIGSTAHHADRYKTIPIVRSPRAGGERSIMSLPPAEVGPILDDTLLRANAEFEVTLQCFEPGQRCFAGSPRYSFSPTVRWKLVIAPRPGETRSSRTLDLTGWQDRECSHRVPNRNHHCVYTVQGRRGIGSPNELPCAPRDCHVNLIVEAFDPKASGGDELAIGSVETSGRISQDRGQINSVLLGTRGRPADEVKRTSGERRRSIPVSLHGTPEHIVYTIRFESLRAGDQLAITGKLIGDLHALPYNALFVSQIILSRSRSTHRLDGLRNFLSRNGLVNKSNGFNCTVGDSAFQSPCARLKYGSVRVLRHVDKPVYVHLVASANYQAGGPFRPGSMKFGSAGFLKVERFRAG